MKNKYTNIMNNIKQEITLYTILDPEIGKRTVHRGYVLVNEKYPSLIQFCATAELREDGIYAETNHSIYKIMYVNILPDWAQGESRYLPKPYNIEITGNHFSGELNGRTIVGRISRESDEWWEVVNARDIVRYLK